MNNEEEIKSIVTKCCIKAILALNDFARKQIGIKDVKKALTECAQELDEIFYKNYQLLTQNPNYTEYLSVILQISSLARNIELLGSQYGYDFLRDELFSLIESYKRLKKHESEV